jgi:predicted NUDIX family NTP pyrophosphohydrolase
MKTSAGILLYRRRDGELQVFLVHPGGPFWARKDDGAWSIPKGEFTTEPPLEAALREFEEETGVRLEGAFQPLTPLRQSGSKIVHAWAVEGRLDPGHLRSNVFSIEWPKGSGKMREYPEVDRAAWYAIPVARQKILKGQLSLLDELERVLTDPSSAAH